MFDDWTAAPAAAVPVWTACSRRHGSTTSTAAADSGGIRQHGAAGQRSGSAGAPATASEEEESATVAGSHPRVASPSAAAATGDAPTARSTSPTDRPGGRCRLGDNFIPAATAERCLAATAAADNRPDAAAAAASSAPLSDAALAARSRRLCSVRFDSAGRRVPAAGADEPACWCHGRVVPYRSLPVDAVAGLARSFARSVVELVAALWALRLVGRHIESAAAVPPKSPDSGRLPFSAAGRPAESRRPRTE